MSNLSSVNFYKYEGAGNDFILIDDRDLRFPISLVPRLCHRKLGIGADGVILLQPDFRMRIFNADGSEAESCGNGLRCLGKFLLDLGYPEAVYPIRIGERIVPVACSQGEIAVDMGEPKDLALHLRIDSHLLHFVDSGVPHAVLFVDDVDAVPLETIGPYLRQHPHFQPRGTNVNFASLQSNGTIRARTFERGIDEEVLACGTGACAIGVVAKELFGMESTEVRFKGGTLRISFHGPRIQMAGPARFVFRGSSGAPAKRFSTTEHAEHTEKK